MSQKKRKKIMKSMYTKPLADLISIEAVDVIRTSDPENDLDVNKLFPTQGV